MTDTDHAVQLAAFCTEWLKQNANYDLIDHSFGKEHGGELTVSKLRAALAELERLRALTAGLRQYWGVQAEHSKNAFPAFNREQAQSQAAQFSRLREPGCLPTPHYVVTRLEGDWQRVEADSAPQQPEPCDGDCDCECQSGQPCLCPERDCYCGPCPVCDRDEGAQQPERGAEET